MTSRDTCPIKLRLSLSALGSGSCERWYSEPGNRLSRWSIADLGESCTRLKRRKAHPLFGCSLSVHASTRRDYSAIPLARSVFLSPFGLYQSTQACGPPTPSCGHHAEVADRSCPSPAVGRGLSERVRHSCARGGGAWARSDGYIGISRFALSAIGQ